MATKIALTTQMKQTAHPQYRQQQQQTQQHQQEVHIHQI